MRSLGKESCGIIKDNKVSMNNFLFYKVKPMSSDDLPDDTGNREIAKWIPVSLVTVLIGVIILLLL